MARKRIGEIWIEAGILTESVLLAALERQKGSGKRLGQILGEMGHLSERDIAFALAKQFGYKTVSGLAGHSFPEKVLGLVAGENALKNFIFPLKLEGKTLFLAMANPLDMETLNNLSFRTGLRIVPCVTTPADILSGVHKHYFGMKEEDAPWKNALLTILVVDDQALVRSFLAAALQKVGYEVVQASNGMEGLKAAFQRHPHLIITDTVMPQMNGCEMFGALRRNAETRDIPVIALSSKAAAEEEARLLDQGYFDFIPKPINPVRLAARVRRALRMVYPDMAGGINQAIPEAEKRGVAAKGGLGSEH